MKWPKRILMIILSGALLLTFGCTPSRELKDMDIIEGMGIDLTPSGDYQVTYQIFRSQDENGSEKVSILQTTGKNLFECSRNITTQTGKRLYYSNQRAVIFGQSVAQKGIKPLMDFFARNHELRLGERLFVAEKNAADILTAKDDNGIIPSQEYERVSTNENFTSKVVDMQLGEAIQRMSTDSDCLYIPVLTKQQKTEGSTSSAGGQGQSSGSSSSPGGTSSATSSASGSPSGKDILQVSRTAVFDHAGKLSTFLTPEETRGFMWTHSGDVGGVLSVTLSNGQLVSLEIKGNQSKLSVQKDSFTIDLSFQTALTETPDFMQDVTRSQFTNDIISKQNSQVKQEIQNALQTSFFNGNTDIFRIGSTYFHSFPDRWRQLQANWPKSGKNLKPIIHVKSTVSLYG
ncbi:MAG TPA: hypothetical protein DEP42_07540 [Ruminococcaceae bacterium]|nr:hypothetical protein [Oscillospiraceae bacterium]